MKVVTIREPFATLIKDKNIGMFEIASGGSTLAYLRLPELNNGVLSCSL